MHVSPVAHSLPNVEIIELLLREISQTPVSTTVCFIIKFEHSVLQQINGFQSIVATSPNESLFRRIRVVTSFL